MKCRKYTQEQDDLLRESISKSYTVYELTEKFNKKFPEHATEHRNLRKRLEKLGLRKDTHNIRPEKVHHTKPLGYVLSGKNGHSARVKTKNGYVQAMPYFKKLYFENEDRNTRIIHLNGDRNDFSRENLELVNSDVFNSMQWRGWFFTDPELTKTAILTTKLLMFFPDLRHNENQYYRLLRSETND